MWTLKSGRMAPNGGKFENNKDGSPNDNRTIDAKWREI
jgi:hypothetical protein